MVKFQLALFRGPGSFSTYTGRSYDPDLAVDTLNHYNNFTHVIFSMQRTPLNEV